LLESPRPSTPSPPSEGGEGRGEEGRYDWKFPSPQPSPLPAPPSRGEGVPKPNDVRMRPGLALPGSTSANDSGKLQTVMKPNSYEMILWWSKEDDAYVVDVPELPGCLAHGATRQQAIKNAEAAIKF